MKVFITHYSKYADRKQHVIEQLKKANISEYTFVELYDKDQITSKEKSLFVDNFSTAIMSLVLKHFHIYKEIKQNHESGLIFEDDIILSDNFSTILNTYVSEVPGDYDMLFIGDGCKLHIPNHQLVKDKHIYRKVYGNGNEPTRCTDSYIVSKKFATKICFYIENLSYKIEKNIDWWLNRAVKDNGFIVYWAEPTIVTQGSQNGLFKTSF
jgi:glycosyl transferase family 25